MQLLLRSAGAPGTRDLMLISSSSDCKVVPMPSKERFILSLKLLLFLGKDNWCEDQFHAQKHSNKFEQYRLLLFALNDEWLNYSVL